MTTGVVSILSIIGALWLFTVCGMYKHNSDHAEIRIKNSLEADVVALLDIKKREVDDKLEKFIKKS